MPIFTINVPATFAFDVPAATAEDAARIARELLAAADPINDSYGGLSPKFCAPWIAVSGHDTAYSELEIVETYDPDSDAIEKATKGT